ncbi:MAG TPA: hypothetical protein VHD83_12165 [Puia sp.]|nr:hypothetical protein [Puia sp.]
MNIGDEFLITCKRNYFDKVTPSNAESKQKEGYKKLVSIANEYFKGNKYGEFAGFLQEGQYFIQLWAAHLVLEYGIPDRELMLSALNLIKNYSDNPLAQEVALEERKWLEANMHKYG